jgi:hypothetical protein
MKKYIALIVVVVLVLGFVFSRRPNGNKPIVVDSQTAKEQLLKLPESWGIIDDANVNLKFEKKVDTGLKPQIVFTKTESKEATTSPAKYVDRLVAGAKSTIPSFKIVSDKRGSEENLYSALISGYYYNQKQKISILQRVYIKDGSVFTMTASYSSDIGSEIENIFDSISREEVKI